MNEEAENNDNSVDKDARTWALICHLSALAGYVIPFGNILGPLVVWMVKKDTHAFVDEQGKEAVNFQITVTLAVVVSVILIFVLIGFFLLAIVAVYSLVMMIIAAMKVNEGENYRYPYTLRLIK